MLEKRIKDFNLKILKKYQFKDNITLLKNVKSSIYYNGKEYEYNYDEISENELDIPDLDDNNYVVMFDVYSEIYFKLKIEKVSNEL